MVNGCLTSDDPIMAFPQTRWKLYCRIGKAIIGLLPEWTKSFWCTNIKIFRHSTGDTNITDTQSLTAVAEDANGDIWIATFKGSVAFESTGNFQTYLFDNPNRKFELANRIYNLVPDREGNIWRRVVVFGIWYRYGHSHIVWRHTQYTALKYQLIAIVDMDSVRKGHGSYSLWCSFF